VSKGKGSRSLTVGFLIALVFAAALFAGCAVGPDFKTPAAPETGSYVMGKAPEKTVSVPDQGVQEQRFLRGRDIPGEWWTLFGCKDLDRLIRKAMKDNPTVAAAEAALRQSREYYRAGEGAYYPWVDAGATEVRQKTSGLASRQPNPNTSPYTLFNASVSVSYTLDLFGSMRRELESLRAQVDYQAFQLEAAYLALSANIVTTVIQEASLREQIRSTREIVDAEEKQLDVVQRQFELGAVARSSVLALRSQLSQTRASIPVFEKRLEATRHSLAVLTGTLPGQAELPEFTMDGLILPADLPVTLPSELVRRRPDIRASEALLHSASAQVGVATANLYPQFTLSATYGSQALHARDLFDPGSAFWNLGAGVLQPVFHGGELTAMRRAAIAGYDQSTALYRQTVLTAFAEVADVLRALEADARILKAQTEAERDAAETLDLIGRQYSLGSVSYLNLLDAQRQEHQARVLLVQAEAVRYADTAALFQALGGGWWNRSGEGADRKAGGE
jgi:NodT family efflux transporter outer membrane factor (OMF) lipoprotein